MYWYRDSIGKLFPFVREESDYYISREPTGYINIIKKEDAEKVVT